MLVTHTFYLIKYSWIFEAVSGQLEIFSFFCGRLPKSTWESIVYLSLTSFIAFKFQYSDLYIWIWISCFQHGHDIVLRFYFKKKKKKKTKLWTRKKNQYRPDIKVQHILWKPSNKSCWTNLWYFRWEQIC